MTIHGALVDVDGTGVLILGSSGIGKSECALELVSRGHRLVADDVIELHVVDNALVGQAPERVRHHMEIRGLGIIYVPELYGEDAVADRAMVDLICRLERWNEAAEYERLGLERSHQEIEGVKIPQLTLPSRPGASMATIVEVAAREHRVRATGINAAARLDARLRDEMQRS